MPLNAISNRRRMPFGWFLIVVFVAANGLGFQTVLGGEEEGAASAKSLSRAFRAAAHKVIPTVVKVTSISKRKTVEGVPGKTPGVNPFKGTPFEDLYNDEDLPPGMQFHAQIPPHMGIGSGVIMDPSGIILTNNHVVRGADEVLVELVDGRQLKATDIKSDEKSDLAVMRVKAGAPLPAATFGDSDALDIGDWVIAVGCPFELDSTVSAGIISGKGRVLSPDSRASYLQTDAAINPGNSGGPLVNIDGEIVGINTAIASNSGGYEGIGFAIPINLAKWVTAQLIKTGTVQRAYLGVKIGEINGALANQFGVAPNSGVVVSEVLPNSPAAASGFEEFDIILSFEGKKVLNPQQLQEIVERSSKGSKQQVEILRGGKKINLQVEVQSLPGKITTTAGPSTGRDKNKEKEYGPTYASKELGIEVSDLPPEIAKRLELPNASGVLVAMVQRDSVASSSGIREGMVILRVGKKPVQSIAEFKNAVQEESLEKGVLLLVRTQNGNRIVLLR